MVQKIFRGATVCCCWGWAMGQKISRKKVPETLDKGGLLVIYLHRQTGVRPSVFDKNQVAVEKFFNNITRCTSAC